MLTVRVARSSSMANQHRASRGHTHDPYPCCDEPPESPYGRPKKGICEECRGLIEDGKLARASGANRKDAVYRWTERSYAWAGYYGVWEFSRPDGGGFENTGSDLTEAMYALVNLLVKPPPENWLEETGDDPIENLLETGIPIGSRRADFGRTVGMSPEVRQALDALNAAIRAVLADVYQTGREEGSNLLLKLAGGEVTTDDFNIRLQRKEREE